MPYLLQEDQSEERTEGGGEYPGILLEYFVFVRCVEKQIATKDVETTDRLWICKWYATVERKPQRKLEIM